MRKKLWLATSLFVAVTTISAALDFGNLVWEGAGTVSDGVLIIEDDSPAGGNYAISAPMPVTSAQSWKFSVEARCENVVNDGRTQCYVMLYDVENKYLKDFGTKALYHTTEWTRLTVAVPPEQWPAETANVRLILQPAAGPASGIGKAWFRNLKFVALESPGPLSGLEATGEYLFKCGRLAIANEKIHSFPFGEEPDTPRLEIQRLEPAYADELQLMTEDDLGNTVKIAVWDDTAQTFGEWRELPLQEVPGGYRLNLRPLECWRRIAMEFSASTTIAFDDVTLTRRELAVENWDAKWIFCTRERVEHFTMLFRREFELETLPEHAWLQCRFDDGGEMWFNGQKASSHSDVASLLRVGTNVIAVRLHQDRYAGGLLAELDLLFPDGNARKIVTDQSWRFYPSLAEILRQSENLAPPPALPEEWKLPGFDAADWESCAEIGRPPVVWGPIPYTRHAPRTLCRLETTFAPTALQAGQSYAQEVRLHFDQPIEGDRMAQVRLVRDGVEFQKWTLGVLPTGTTEVALPFQFTLSPFLAEGEYELRLEIPEYITTNLDGISCNIIKVTISNSRVATMADARIQRDAHGVPALTIDGQACHSIFSARWDFDTLNQHAEQFHTAGLHFYHAYLIPSWPQPDTPCYTNVDALADTLLRGDPDARFVLKIELRDGQPKWYLPMFPEDAVVFDNGGKGSRVSLASRRWKQLVGEYLRGLIAHVAASPYADRVIGYFPGEGNEGQWMHYWGGDDPAVPGTMSDYSQPMREYFRDWLARKYGTDEALQAAWDDPDVTLATAAIPTNLERTAGEGAFRVLPRDQRSADFGWALSDVNSEGLEYYAKIIKEASGGKALVGALYGHLLDLGACFLGEQVGYARQKRVVESPYIDYFLGPISYAQFFRDLGGTGSYDMPSPATLALHNKIWINENDLRTHLQFPADYAYSVRTPAQTTRLLAREFARALCLRGGYYLFALARDVNWFDDPETMDTIRQLRELGDQTIAADRTSVSEIASFFDDETQCRLTQTPALGSCPTVNLHAIFQREPLFRIGAPVDEYLQFDVANPKLPAYKFYVFLNPYYIKDEEFSAIRNLAARPDVRILFAFTPGLAGDHGLTSAVAESLTGMKFTLDTTGKPADFTTARAFGSLPSGSRFGQPEFHLAPIAIPEGYDELLATFDDGTPAVVRKGNLYVSALAVLPVEVLREIASEAGVFLYSEDNLAVVACHDFAAFHSLHADKQCAFRAPEGKLLRQIWPATTSTEAMPEVRWHNTAPETRIFELLPKP